MNIMTTTMSMNMNTSTGIITTIMATMRTRCT